MQTMWVGKLNKGMSTTNQHQDDVSAFLLGARVLSSGGRKRLDKNHHSVHCIASGEGRNARRNLNMKGLRV